MAVMGTREAAQPHSRQERRETGREIVETIEKWLIEGSGVDSAGAALAAADERGHIQLVSGCGACVVQYRSPILMQVYARAGRGWKETTVASRASDLASKDDATSSSASSALVRGSSCCCGGGGIDARGLATRTEPAEVARRRLRVELPGRVCPCCCRTTGSYWP